MNVYGQSVAPPLTATYPRWPNWYTLFSTPQCIRASRTRSGRTSAVMISSGLAVSPWAMTSPSKLTIMPSPMLSKSPSVPHMHTLAVTIRFWNELAWLVNLQELRIGAVYPAVRIMISAPLYAHSRLISGNMPSWQMISASLQPLGPSHTGMPTFPGSHGSTGIQGCNLR